MRQMLLADTASIVGNGNIHPGFHYFGRNIQICCSAVHYGIADEVVKGRQHQRSIAVDGDSLRKR